ncbi:MAG TPA: glycosyltransferase [Nocardioidaceae bacterium]|nr:glycosyltransferase [Nocardioidaceae bacterium]
MTTAASDISGLAALEQRLTAVGHHLLDGSAPVDGDDPAAVCDVLLARMVESVMEAPTQDRIWLLLVGLTATFPTDDEVLAAQRHLEVDSVSGALRWLLDQAFAVAMSHGSGAHRVRVVRDTVVDVDFTAKHDLQTGIQRVVRSLVPRWHRDHGVEIAVWTEGAGALREPVADERERVLRWQRPLGRFTVPPAQPVVVVPWRATLVLPEVPGIAQSRRLVSLAAHSPNRVVLVGYDCIPVVSADLLPIAEPTRFAQFLAVVKHSDVVAAISDSAAREFRGFVHALPTQGLPGPEVTSCCLPFERPSAAGDDAGRVQEAEPEVLVVGSHDPRKNHLAVLHASEVLWRQGMRFTLRLLGSGGWTTRAFDRQVEELRKAGRPVLVERGMEDDHLWAAYRNARFSVLTSFHEGFGLPVAESLAAGTPAIVSGYGALAETAAGGGALLVDPRDDAALIDAMRLLLTDDDALAQLRREAQGRTSRSWDDYARELWAITKGAR